jgi:hypothetical protein
MVVSKSISCSNTMKFDDVVCVIVSEKMIWKIPGETLGNALTMENKESQKERGNRSWNCGNYRKGKSKSRLGKIECWNCAKKGNLKKDYRALKKQIDGQQEKNQEANVTGDVLQDTLILSLDNIIESWVLYLEASFHATPHRKYLQDYGQGDFGQVFFGDDEACQIVGMGKVQINKNNGNK